MNRRLLRTVLASGLLAATPMCTREPIPLSQPSSTTAAPATAGRSAAPEPESAKTAGAPVLNPKPAPTIPLFRRFPALASKLPYIALGSLPTPIERADALGAALGVPRLYIKRDDLSGPEYGGNKTRKLEFFLADAIAQHKKTVVTSGAAGSNHALATAIYARKLGLRAILLLLPQPNSDLVRRNLLADQLAGAEIRLAPAQKRIKALEDDLVRKSAPGDEPYIIDAGGSSPLGNIGYVNAAFELADQIAAGQIPEPDRIYVAMGTMGCAVGLRLGIEAAGLHTKLIPVRASTQEVATDPKMIAMFNETNALLRSLDPSFPKLTLKPGETWIENGYLGAGYTIPTPKGKAAITLFKEHTGITLEPTYTGKTLAALIDAAPKLSGEVVVFWNTFNSRKLDLRGARVRDLPATFQDYFVAVQTAPRSRGVSTSQPSVSSMASRIASGSEIGRPWTASSPSTSVNRESSLSPVK